MLKIVLKDAYNVENWHLEKAKALIDAVQTTNPIFAIFKQNIARNLTAFATNHKAIEAEYETIPRNNDFDEFVDIMKVLYNKYSNKYGYELIEKVGLKTCPYCNRAYTFIGTRSNKKGVRPELDHFAPKSKVPALALNLYNMIPACPSCNHLKKARRMILNPYLNSSQEVFKLDNVADASSLKLLPEDSDYKTVLLLDKLYAQHQDYVQEILDKAVAYNNSAYDGLLEDFQAMAKTPAELERLVWGTYLEESEYHKRPLSKLTGDILKQLGIL